MADIVVNQDIGGGWRLISLTQPDPASKLLLAELSFDGKIFLSRFDPIKVILLDPPTNLTQAQLHFIEVAALQLLR